MKPEHEVCPEASELDAFGRGVLDARRASAIEAHLPACGDCRAATKDVEDSGIFGRMLRDWRSRMPPDERQRTIDSATRSIHAARRPKPDGGA